MAAGDEPVVLLGGSYNALSAARSLGRRGIAVHALGDGLGNGLVERSRHTTTWFDPHPGTDVQRAWLDWLATRGPHAGVVLACGDDGLELLANRRTDVEALGYLVPPAADGLVLDLLDKARTYELAAAAGVPVPTTVFVRSVADLHDAGSCIGFPCALKPVHSHRWARQGRRGKAVVVRDAPSLERLGQELLDAGLAMLVTEIVPGDDSRFTSYYTWIDDDGTPAFHFTKHKLRQYPIGFGTGTFHVVTRDPAVAEIGLELFRRIGLRGLGNVEFKRDARDGTLRLIECNLRITAANELLLRAGLDLAWFVWCRTTGRDVELPPEFREGQTMCVPSRDVRALRDYRRAGQLSVPRWVASVTRRVPTLPVFSWRDPAPALAGLVGTVSKVRGRVGRGRG